MAMKHCGNTSNPLKYLECTGNNYVHEKSRKKPPPTTPQLILTESIELTRIYPRKSNKCKKLYDALVAKIVHISPMRYPAGKLSQEDFCLIIKL